ncbi:YebC/PmpR family DNA-binding transcriptional regulator [bacterium]|nr:MAG: YebC/PmpR family DNA-binding transcriptional regulator [bacterium]
MSGHSKWSTIKRAKGAADAKRAVIFGKLSKKISVAAREGNSGDPTHNFRLRVEVDKAKAAGMPNDNIDRAIKKGLGLDGSARLEEAVYEGYGPGGSAFYIEAVTDNKNRTVQSIKTIFTRNNGNMGGQGSVAWQFSKNSEGEFESNQPLELSEEDLAKAEKLYDALENDDDVTAVYTNIA